MEKLRLRVYKLEINGRGIRCADHAAPSIRKSWHQLRRDGAVTRSVLFSSGLKPRGFI
jgi:hypothetical protein